MESNDAQGELADLERLRVATLGEQSQIQHWAFPMLFGVGVLCLAVFVAVAVAGHPVGGIVAAAVAWNAFIAIWGHAVRRPNRARPRRSFDAKRSRNWLIETIAVNAALWGLVALFGYRIFVVVALGYVGYLLRIALPDFRRMMSDGSQ